MLTVPTTPGIGFRFVCAGLGLLWAIDKPLSVSPAEAAGFDAPPALSPSLPESLLAIARGVSEEVEECGVEELCAEVVAADAEACAVAGAAVGAVDGAELAVEEAGSDEVWDRVPGSGESPAL